MVQARKIELTVVQTQELQQVRDHAAQPYLRVRAAGILKVTQGHSIRWVAKHGLLKPVHPDRLREWINRYLAEGADGLRVRAGRGRKPVFFPSAREH
jgi:hypothetical protein